MFRFPIKAHGTSNPVLIEFGEIPRYKRNTITRYKDIETDKVIRQMSFYAHREGSFNNAFGRGARFQKRTSRGRF